MSMVIIDTSLPDFIETLSILLLSLVVLCGNQNLGYMIHYQTTEAILVLTPHAHNQGPSYVGVLPQNVPLSIESFLMLFISQLIHLTYLCNYLC